jgi:hypothetical protein
MVGKLQRLPVETQQSLQQLAYLGNVAEVTSLSIVLDVFVAIGGIFFKSCLYGLRGV